ncbi:MAG: hypothetical protein WBM75_21680, partial [Polyangiales bacterium]
MSPTARGTRIATLISATLLLLGCNEARDRPQPPVIFADVDPILQESCLECHTGPLAETDYRVEDYFTTIRCIPDPEGQPATLPADESAPILAVLQQPSHA